jgi:hypothetical protein
MPANVPISACGTGASNLVAEKLKAISKQDEEALCLPKSHVEQLGDEDCLQEVGLGIGGSPMSRQRCHYDNSWHNS